MSSPTKRARGLFSCQGILKRVTAIFVINSRSSGNSRRRLCRGKLRTTVSSSRPTSQTSKSLGKSRTAVTIYLLTPIASETDDEDVACKISSRRERSEVEPVVLEKIGRASCRERV